MADELSKEPLHLGSGDTITVAHYEIFLNGRLTTRALVGRSVPIFAVFNSLSKPCTKDNTSGGWYEASEVSTSFAPFVLNITASFRGKEYTVRHVQSTDLAIRLKSPDAQKALIGAMTTTTQLLAAEIAKNSGGSVPP